MAVGVTIYMHSGCTVFSYRKVCMPNYISTSPPVSISMLTSPPRATVEIVLMLAAHENDINE